MKQISVQQMVLTMSCIFQSTPELAKLWNIGCHMWKRDFPEIYAAIKQEWSPSVQPILTALQGTVHIKFFRSERDLCSCEVT